MLDPLASDDVLMVTRLDRLARTTFDPLAIVKQIVDAKAQSDHWRSRGPTPAQAPGG
jgi:DNA invertase Pin-like site-specific DNA recombinase